MIAGWALLIPFNPPAAAAVLVRTSRGVLSVIISFFSALLEELGISIPALAMATPAVGAFLARTAIPLLSDFLWHTFVFMMNQLLPMFIPSIIQTALSSFGFEFLSAFLDGLD